MQINITTYTEKGTAEAMPSDYFFFRLAFKSAIKRVEKTKAATRNSSRTMPETEDIRLKVLIISTLVTGSRMGSATKTQISI